MVILLIRRSYIRSTSICVCVCVCVYVCMYVWCNVQRLFRMFVTVPGLPLLQARKTKWIELSVAVAYYSKRCPRKSNTKSRAREFSVLRNIQTCCGAHLAVCSVVEHSFASFYVSVCWADRKCQICFECLRNIRQVFGYFWGAELVLHSLF